MNCTSLHFIVEDKKSRETFISSGSRSINGFKMIPIQLHNLLSSIFKQKEGPKYHLTVEGLALNDGNFPQFEKGCHNSF